MELKTYLLLVMLKLSASNENVDIIQQSTNWNEANNGCVNRGGRLAHPDEFHPSTCSNKSINVWLHKQDHERLTPWIAKIGCIQRNQTLRYSKPSLLECYRSCKSTQFGYKEPWCSCEDGTKTTVDLPSPSTCTSLEIHFDALWLFKKTDLEIDVSDDNYTMDCITAQCKQNETIFRAVDCSSKRKAACRDAQDSEKIIHTIDNQVKSEKRCNGETSYLISNLKCLSNGKRVTEEVWTGIKRYRYTVTESLTENDRKDDTSTDLLNCVYVKCPIESGHVTLVHTENCKRQFHGFACLINATSENITTGTISASESNSLHLENISTNGPPSSIVKTSLWMNESVLMITQLNTDSLIQHTSASMNSQWDKDSLILQTSALVPSQSNIESSILQTSVIMHSQSNTNSLILQTSALIHSQSSKTEGSILQTSALIHSQSNKDSAMLQTSAIMHSQSNIESSILKTSVTMQSESNIKSSIQQTNVKIQSLSNIASAILQNGPTSDLIYAHTSKTVVSLTTVSRSHIYSFVDMSSTVDSSFVKHKSETASNGGKKIYNSTTRNQQDNSKNQQLSTGLIVGISVSILCLVVLIIGGIGICRLRNQRAYNDKSLGCPSPINTTNTHQYQDFGFDSKKETKVIENDSTHPVVSANDDSMVFRLTDNTSNGNTNKPNDPYAAVMKKPVTNKADNTSNSKTTKSNKAQDEYAVVVKIPEKDLDKDEQTSLDIPESNYDSMNQPRPISDNESGNISDTSTGHCDNSDPT